eukprot:3252863-Alexandrium_andersonii.AAC.1
MGLPPRAAFALRRPTSLCMPALRLPALLLHPPAAAARLPPCPAAMASTTAVGRPTAAASLA